MEAFPKSKVVLTLRDPEAWLQFCQFNNQEIE